LITASKYKYNFWTQRWRWDMRWLEDGSEWKQKKNFQSKTRLVTLQCFLQTLRNLD
jgi:hypothetical protein